VTADSKDSVALLELAGASSVLQLGRLLGDAFAKRILAPSGRSNMLNRFQDLLLAETAAADSDLVGRTLRELHVREEIGVSVVGVWQRGRFELAHADLRIEQSSILVLAGTQAQLDAYDERYHHAVTVNGTEVAAGHVVIVGGGRVGRAAARAPREAGTSCTIVERLAEGVRTHELDSVLRCCVQRTARCGGAVTSVWRCCGEGDVPSRDDGRRHSVVATNRRRPGGRGDPRGRGRTQDP
jgi:voltage-gated potassium channel